MSKYAKWTFLSIGILLLALLLGGNKLFSRIFGEVKYTNVQMRPGNIEVPVTRTLVWKTQSAFADSICNVWAGKSVTDKEMNGKGLPPRVLLAKLWMKRDIPEVNKSILKQTVWGITGSSWLLNKKGDYDFSLTVLTTILFFFGDQPELLYPETKDYLLNVLLTEEGNKFRATAPNSLGLVNETENHLLMTEGSRYLKNRWLMNHGNNDPKYDNVGNGMEDKLLACITDMKTNGLYEFNSLPYIGYTIAALLNIEAFASDKLKVEARNLLDYMNWTYALGSYKLKHYAPMRRRYEKAWIKDITIDYQSIFMKSWLSFSPVTDYDKKIHNVDVHALMGAIMPYRPADKVVEMIFNKEEGYFIKLGHGPEASPEIYAAGKKFLISAGGVNRGKRSLIIPRPTILFLNDQAAKLSETFHLSGPSDDFMKWKNTGVYSNFACAAGPVAVPEGYKPVAENTTWKLFETKDSVVIAIHNTVDLGIMALFENQNPQDLAKKLMEANPDPEKLKVEFRFPAGSLIEYDIDSPKDKWVIKSFDGKPLNRDYDNWSLIEGEMNSKNSK